MSESLPFGGDLNAAMRAQDRAAIRLLMEHRDSVAAPAAAATSEPAPAAARAPTGGAAATEPEPSRSEVTVVAAAGVCDGPLVSVNVKFGKAVVPLTINVGAGVPPILELLAEATKVPVSSQTLLGPGGRKWTAASDLSTFGVKEGMKLTLIGKVPPGWRALEAIEKAAAPLGEQVASISSEAASATEGLGLEEKLTKLLLQLDGVAAGEDVELRAARKQRVERIQSMLDELESRR